MVRSRATRKRARKLQTSVAQNLKLRGWNRSGFAGGPPGPPPGPPGPRGPPGPPGPWDPGGPPSGPSCPRGGGRPGESGASFSSSLGSTEVCPVRKTGRDWRLPSDELVECMAAMVDDVRTTRGRPVSSLGPSSEARRRRAQIRTSEGRKEKKSEGVKRESLSTSYERTREWGTRELKPDLPRAKYAPYRRK